MGWPLWLVVVGAAAAELRGRSWRGVREPVLPDPSFAWPEHALEELMGRTANTAVLFSGGGARAFGAALGQLAALRDLGLLPKIRYAAGVSGGSWATASFSFHSPNVSQDVFLGPTTAPQDLTLDAVTTFEEGSARQRPNDRSDVRAGTSVKIDPVVDGRRARVPVPLRRRAAPGCRAAQTQREPRRRLVPSPASLCFFFFFSRAIHEGATARTTCISRRRTSRAPRSPRGRKKRRTRRERARASAPTSRSRL